MNKAAVNDLDFVICMLVCMTPTIFDAFFIDIFCHPISALSLTSTAFLLSIQNGQFTVYLCAGF